jgi:hypothetical protein
MSAADVALFVGKLVACWSLGFTGGFLLTAFKNAISHV